MDEATIEKFKNKAEELYRSGDYLCSEAILSVVNECLGNPLPSESVRLASGFPVGMGGSGCSCGALIGAVMSLGLKYGRTGPRQENQTVMALSKEIHDEFKQRFGSTCCRALIRNLNFGSPEHLNHCVALTGAAAVMVLRRLS